MYAPSFVSAEESKLVGLVYSLTPKPEEEPLAWYARPAVNLYWGVVLLAFGALMYALSRRAARPEARGQNTPKSPRSSGH